NAAEALENSAFREILVSTLAHSDAETVVICVSDTGTGISPEDKDKLFLPHFSTKDRGTGLGLAIAARLVAEPGGSRHVAATLPGIDGLEALSRLQASPRPPAVIMISGHGTIETAVRATKLGAFDFIEKPLSLEKIIVLVRNAIQQRRLEDENQVLRSELGYRYQVIGDSIPMKALRQQIAVTAPTNGRVLIYGESGTGKELVARALHAASLRS